MPLPRPRPRLQRLARRLLGARLDAALLEAVEDWRPRRVRSLLWLGADPRGATFRYGIPSLVCRVARMGSDEILEALLDFGADPNDALGPPDGSLRQWGPIHHAALKGRGSTIRLLAARGADFLAQANPGWDPVYIAARENRPEALLALADVGAPLDRPDGDTGETPVMLCARRGFLESLEALLSRGAPHSPRTPEGATALHLAAAGGFEAACRALFLAGADPSAPGPFGSTPIRAALAEGHDALAAAPGPSPAEPRRRRGL